MGLVLSTSWNAFRHTSALPLIREIKAIGFKRVELSFNLTSSIVKGIERLVKNRYIEVKSVHNFCPVPRGVSRRKALPDYYSMASLDEGERRKAVKQTKETIETAASLGAEALVLHAGRVEIPDKTRELIGLYNKNLKDSKAFKDLKIKAIKEREASAGPSLRNALRSLEEINAYASKKRILLGLENRFYYREIPSFEEIGIILKRLGGSSLFYWHDTGHSRVMENLGFNRQKEYLSLYAGRMLGIHLHDAIGCKDHQAPLEGDIDFKALKPYLKDRTIKVIEAHYPATVPQLKKSSKFLEELFNEKP